MGTSKRNDAELSAQLLSLLGIEGFVLLTEKFGGLRMYIPAEPKKSVLVDDLTIQHLTKLSEEFPGLYIRVPLTRELRAAHYRTLGFSHRRIARLIGITESGVDILMKRLDRQGKKPEKGLPVATDELT